MLLRDNVTYTLLRSLMGNLQILFKSCMLQLHALFFVSFERGWYNGFSRSIFAFTYTRI